MTDWIDELAREIGVEAPTAEESERLLDVSREVAHRVERRITPLSTFVLGMGVAARMAEGATRDTAFQESLEALVRRLPDPKDGRSARHGQPRDRRTG